MADNPETRPVASRPYKFALAVAVSLLLLTLTAAIVLILISSAEEQQRTEDIELTLTQAFASLDQTATGLAPAPAGAPPIASGAFPFHVAPAGVVYDQAPACDVQTVDGVVLDAAGIATDGFQILLWGDYLDPQMALTGALAAQPAGGWALALEGNTNRRVWAQLLGDRRTLSPPVEIVFDEGACERNRATVTFQQTGPLS